MTLTVFPLATPRSDYLNGFFPDNGTDSMAGPGVAWYHWLSITLLMCSGWLGPGRWLPAGRLVVEHLKKYPPEDYRELIRLSFITF